MHGSQSVYIIFIISEGYTGAFTSLSKPYYLCNGVAVGATLAWWRSHLKACMSVLAVELSSVCLRKVSSKILKTELSVVDCLKVASFLACRKKTQYLAWSANVPGTSVCVVRLIDACSWDYNVSPKTVCSFRGRIFASSNSLLLTLTNVVLSLVAPRLVNLNAIQFKMT